MHRPHWLQKEHLLLQNLKLLGFREKEAQTDHDRAYNARSDTEACHTLVYKGMFDRPNEKTLLAILYHVLKLVPSTHQEELVFCWPLITPQDKAAFKRKAQLILQDLEKKGDLPLGSSQISRISTGHGPRVIDLVWRLSSYIIRKNLRSDFQLSDHVEAPANSVETHVQTTTEGLDTLITATQAKIAFKTEEIKRKCVMYSRAQTAWIRCAQDFSSQIQDLDRAQRKVQEELAKWDTSVNREIFTQQADLSRKQSIADLQKAWVGIQEAFSLTEHQDVKKVLETTQAFSDYRPRLIGSELVDTTDHARRSLDGNVDLEDIVQGACALVGSMNTQLNKSDVDDKTIEDEDSINKERLTEMQIQRASITAMIERLQSEVDKVRSHNEAAAREACIELANGNYLQQRDMFCPLTPQLLTTPTRSLLKDSQEESQLIDSLKKITMSELSDFTAKSIRSSAKRKNASAGSGPYECSSQSKALPRPYNPAAGGPITRCLDYHDKDEM